MSSFSENGHAGEADLLRAEAYGAIDEAISALGLARSLVKKDRTKEIILQAQRSLRVIGEEIATEITENKSFAFPLDSIVEGTVDSLERIIDELEAEIEMPQAFVVPGKNLGSAALDLSRSMLRRAERRVTSLNGTGELKNEFLLSYLNRLADLIFVFARYEEK